MSRLEGGSTFSLLEAMRFAKTAVFTGRERAFFFFFHYEKVVTLAAPLFFGLEYIKLCVFVGVGAVFCAPRLSPKSARADA